MKSFLDAIKKKYPVQILQREVVSCEEASLAKGIPLTNELKSLVLTTNKGYYVVHIPGDMMVDLRKIKNYLTVNEAFLASKDDLKKLGVQPGTVSPFVEAIWNLPHLISSDLLLLDFVSTNIGELNKFMNFPPSELLENPCIRIGNFCRKEG